MTDRRPPYHRRQTKPIPREELAPIAPSSSDDVGPEDETRPAIEEAERFARDAENEIATKVKCPLCIGAGMVDPEIASTFEDLTKNAAEKA